MLISFLEAFLSSLVFDEVMFLMAPFRFLRLEELFYLVIVPFRALVDFVFYMPSVANDS